MAQYRSTSSAREYFRVVVLLAPDLRTVILIYWYHIYTSRCFHQATTRLFKMMRGSEKEKLETRMLELARVLDFEEIKELLSTKGVVETSKIQYISVSHNLHI